MLHADRQLIALCRAYHLHNTAIFFSVFLTSSYNMLRPAWTKKGKTEPCGYLGFCDDVFLVDFGHLSYSLLFRLKSHSFLVLDFWILDVFQPSSWKSSTNHSWMAFLFLWPRCSHPLHHLSSCCRLPFPSNCSSTPIIFSVITTIMKKGVNKVHFWSNIDWWLILVRKVHGTRRHASTTSPCRLQPLNSKKILN